MNDVLCCRSTLWVLLRHTRNNKNDDDDNKGKEDIEHMNCQDFITAYLGSSYSSIAEHFAMINDNNNNIKNESFYLTGSKSHYYYYYIINISCH